MTTDSNPYKSPTTGKNANRIYNPPISPIKWGAFFLPIIALLSMLISIENENGDGIILGRAEFAGYVLIAPCMALSGISFVFYLLSKHYKIDKGVQYCIFLFLAALAWYAGDFVVELTDF